MSFRILTFNMQFGQVWEEEDPDHAPICLEDTLEFLRAHPADVLFLQEVEQARPGGLQAHPPANYGRIREALPGTDSVFAYPPVNPDELPFGIGLAIFSRGPLKRFFSEILPPPALEFEFNGKRVKPSPRQLIGATAVFESREIRLLNTHLQAFFMIESSSNEHLDQRKMVEGILRDSSLPTILGGDFNCCPGEDVVEQFGGVGFSTAQNCEPTWKRRPYCLDHIFCAFPLRSINYQILPTHVSDHHAVMAEFEFVD